MLERIRQAGTSALVGRVVQAANAVVVVLAPLLLIAWAIAPARAWLQAHAFFDEATVVGLLGLVISLTLFQFNHLQKRTEDVHRLLGDMATPRSGVIANGVTEVYPELLRELANVLPKDRTVDVLGLTLFTAWNQLQGFLQQPETRGWTVRMLCLCPDFTEAGVAGVPAEWAAEARMQATTIRRFIATQDASLSERRMSLSLECYRAFPAIHGFMLGNGTLFVSVTRWEDGQDELAKPYHPYEKIEASDHSRRADIYRQMFLNWVDHARRTVARPAPEVSRTGS